jgi:PII-like signaling protein
MVTKGPAKKLSIYVDETDKFGAKPVYEVLLDIFYKKKISGVSVFRGIAGYGAKGVFHTAKMLELSTDMPVKIEVVDSQEIIDKVLPDVYHVVQKGLVEVSDTNVIKCCPEAHEKQKEKEREEHMKLEGKAKMLRILISEDDTWEGEPLYEAIVKRLIMNDIAGATVYKALAGYGPHRRYHKKKTLSTHGELPILITIIDTEENINKVIPILDDMVNEGIVVLSDVNVIKYTHRDIGPEIM